MSARLTRRRFLELTLAGAVVFAARSIPVELLTQDQVTERKTELFSKVCDTLGVYPLKAHIVPTTTEKLVIPVLDQDLIGFGPPFLGEEHIELQPYTDGIVTIYVGYSELSNVLMVNLNG